MIGLWNRFILRALLQNALISRHAAVVGQKQNETERAQLDESSLQQNEEVKPHLRLGDLVRPNPGRHHLRHELHNDMPELGWKLGYPMAVLAMLVTGLVLDFVFKRRRWL